MGFSMGTSYIFGSPHTPEDFYKFPPRPCFPRMIGMCDISKPPYGAVDEG